MLFEIILTVIELLGTVAFSVSGALVGISRGLDLFGVIFVGCVTAVGGGITRDLCLGNTPPTVFSNIEILILAVVTAVAVFILAYTNARRFPVLRQKIESINHFFDALGLSAFTVTGTEIACAAGYAENAVFAIVMGMITGVGGGIMRDIFVDQTPYVLKKHVYAVASLAGGCLYYVLRTYTELRVFDTIVAMLLIVSIRLLAAKFHWKLPKVTL